MGLLPQVDAITTAVNGTGKFALEVVTAMSEQLPPEELVAEIHSCFSVFDRVMAEFSVEKIKTIGDAYMAAGGVPSPSPTHALDVIQAAIRIQQFMADRAADRKANGLPYFEMRLGIHTGTVVAGIVGEKKFQYDIWGDAVNVAARMEQCSEPGRINVSKATYELAKDHFTFTYRGKVKAKGKGEIDMHFLHPGP